MAKTKVIKKKKKAPVFQIGSERFKQELGKGRIVRVSLDDWLNYWGQQGKELRAKEEFEREYIRIKGAHDEVVLKLDQAIQKIQQRDRVIVALLLPWAAVLGPVKLYDRLTDLLLFNGTMNAVMVDGKTIGEIQLLIQTALQTIMVEDGNPAGRVKTLRNIIEKFIGYVETSFDEQF